MRVELGMYILARYFGFHVKVVLKLIIFVLSGLLNSNLKSKHLGSNRT